MYVFNFSHKMIPRYYTYTCTSSLWLIRSVPLVHVYLRWRSWFVVFSCFNLIVLWINLLKIWVIPLFLQVYTLILCKCLPLLYSALTECLGYVFVIKGMPETVLTQLSSETESCREKMTLLSKEQHPCMYVVILWHSYCQQKFHNDNCYHW